MYRATGAGFECGNKGLEASVWKATQHAVQSQDGRSGSVCRGVCQEATSPNQRSGRCTPSHGCSGNNTTDTD